VGNIVVFVNEMSVLSINDNYSPVSTFPSLSHSSCPYKQNQTCVATAKLAASAAREAGILFDTTRGSCVEAILAAGALGSGRDEGGGDEDKNTDDGFELHFDCVGLEGRFCSLTVWVIEDEVFFDGLGYRG